MTRFSVRHETLYEYERPVGFGPHRLLVRPRDSHAIRLTDAHLTLSPPGKTRWSFDALGNCVCIYEPSGQAQRLSIVSELSLQRYPAPLDLAMCDPRSATPVDYAMSDRLLLLPFMTPADDGDDGLGDWLRPILGPIGEPAMEFLIRITRCVHDGFAYAAREAEGVQSPAETLRLKSGSCRDYAWLMIEALRHLGYAARFVTGYLHSPGGRTRGAAATHAWTQVFLPDLGWIEFDPTNALVERPDLIPIAITRTPAEAAPVSGEIRGDPGASKLTVRVDVRQEQA